MSRESQFVGYLVLGLGVLSVITVIILAFSNRGVDTDEKAPDARITASLESGLSKGMTSGAAKADNAQLAMARQSGIKAGDLQGGWKAAIGPYVGVLQMDKGVFQIIMARPEPEFSRLFSAGTYKLVDDLIVFTPQMDWKPAGAGNVRYERLTAGQYPMIVGFKNGAMVWQNVPQSEKRVYVPSRSPLLSDTDKNYIVWKKTE